MVSLDKFKLSLVSWDSDKDPGGYPKWVKQWSSVVRSTKWGSQLESFLDRKLKRKFSTKATIPSFLTEDEDLQDAPEAPRYVGFSMRRLLKASSPSKQAGAHVTP